MFVHRCVGLVAALVLASSSALAIDFRLTIAFDKTNPATPLIGEAFAKHIGTASQGRMKVQVSGPRPCRRSNSSNRSRPAYSISV